MPSSWPSLKNPDPDVRVPLHGFNEISSSANSHDDVEESTVTVYDAYVRDRLGSWRSTPT